MTYVGKSTAYERSGVSKRPSVKRPSVGDNARTFSHPRKEAPPCHKTTPRSPACALRSTPRRMTRPQRQPSSSASRSPSKKTALTFEKRRATALFTLLPAVSKARRHLRNLTLAHLGCLDRSPLPPARHRRRRKTGRLSLPTGPFRHIECAHDPPPPRCSRCAAHVFDFP